MANPTWTAAAVLEMTRKVRQNSLTEAEIEFVLEEARAMKYQEGGSLNVIGVTLLDRAVARALDVRFRMTGQSHEPVEVIRRRKQEELGRVEDERPAPKPATLKSFTKHWNP